MRSINLRRFSLAVGSLMLTVSIGTAAGAAGINIAPDGVAIMGLTDSLDGTGDRINFNQGRLEELNDEIYLPASPTGFNIGTGNGVDNYDVDLGGTTTDPINDYVGILWHTPKDNVTSLSFQHYLANDGGWYGPGDQFGAGLPLTAGEIGAPVVQVTTNYGASWTTISNTNDYLATLEGVTRGIAFDNSATSPFVTFNFSPQNGISGIRVIGDAAGSVDPNGFTAFTEFKVFQNPGTVFPKLNINTFTGEVTLSTAAGTGLSIRGYSIESVSGIGALDEEGWSTIATPGNGWTELPGAVPSSLLSESAILESSAPIVLGPNQNLSLGEIWLQNPFQGDIEAYVQLADGRTRRMEVTYNGQPTNPVILGDFNSDGSIDEFDWPTVRDNYRTDLSGLSMIEAYGLGDINFDGSVDATDVVEFKRLYNSANGAGSFEAMLAGGSAIPEPGTCAAVAIAAVTLGWCRRRKG